MIKLAGISLDLPDATGVELIWQHPSFNPNPLEWRCKISDPYIKVSGFGKTPKAAVQAAIERYKEETNG